MKLKSLYLACAMLCTVGYANAAFVALDDPRPPSVDARRQELTQYQLAFLKGTSVMTNEALRNLAELKTLADRNDSFNLVIRQDPDKDDLILANRRASNVKSWLQKRGYNIKNIAVSIEHPAQQHVVGNEIFSSITLVQGSDSTAQSSVAAQPDRFQTVYRPANLRGDIPLAGAATDERREVAAAAQSSAAPSVDAIKAILDLYKTNQLNSSDTARLIAALYAPKPAMGNVPSAAAVAPAPTPRLLTTSYHSPMPEAAPSQQAQQPLVITTTPSEWVLEANSTLQENLARWTALMHWNAPIWEVPKDVQLNIASRQVVRGEFKDALIAIQKACNLRIEYSVANKTIRIQLQPPQAGA
ncbi:hypothetical protein ACIPLR_17895 [Herbaspirillum huttiense]|uniref:hypothetical protein n=1 Tax=Herbaspirillum huttiense TaxID=863372 RepID=UPI0037F6ADA0